MFDGKRIFMKFTLFWLISLCIAEETLVRTKRKPSADDYDYIKDFQKDEEDHSSPVRKQRDATENSTLAKNNAKDDIDNVFNNLVDKSKPGQNNIIYQKPVLTQNPESISANVSLNPKNEIEKFFSDIASKNVQSDDNHQTGVRTGRETVQRCNKSIDTGCRDELDNIFNKIVEKSKVINSSHEDESEFQAIDNVFSNLVEKKHHHSTHVIKRNVNKPRDNSANNFEKLRKMFEVMNKRSINEDEDNSVVEGDKVSGDFESGSGRNEGSSGDVISGSGMAQSSGQSEKMDSPVEKNSITGKSSLLEDKHVTRHHRSSEQEMDLFDLPDVTKKNIASKDGEWRIRNPRSKILEKEERGFPDIPLPFINLDTHDKWNSKKFYRKNGNLSFYPAFTKLIPFKEYKSLDIFKRALGDEKFNSLRIIDEKKAQHLFDNEDGAFLKSLKKDGIYYDMQSKRFLISTEHMPAINMSNYEEMLKYFPSASTNKGMHIAGDKSKETAVKYFNQTIDFNSINKNNFGDEKQKVISYQKKVSVQPLPSKQDVKLDGVVKPTQHNISYFNTNKATDDECDKPCYSSHTLNLRKREILSDDDPYTDELMGNDAFDLEDNERSSKIKRAENLYKFARNVIEVVANNTVIKKKRNTDQTLLGVWSGLGTTPEFVRGLVANEYRRGSSRIQKRSKLYTNDIPRRNNKSPLLTDNKARRNIELQKSFVMMNGDNHHFYQGNANKNKPKVEIPTEIKRGLVLSFADNTSKRRKLNTHIYDSDKGLPNISMVKETNLINDVIHSNKQSDTNVVKKYNVEQSESKQIEIGSLGSINMVPRGKLEIEKKSKIVKPKPAKKNKKTKRAEHTPLNKKSLQPVQDGKVVLAFDEVRELLPTKHFFKDDFNDEDMMDPNDERNSRSEIPLARNNVDVDKELADSMLLAGDLESSPYKPDIRTANIEYEGNSIRGKEKNEGNNLISTFNGHKKLKHSQMKYHDDETKGKYTQMKHWLETDQASSFEKEADTARKIQEVIDKLAKSDAELHKLTSTMKNESIEPVKSVSNATVSSAIESFEGKDKDEKFKTLEMEIQEEHANYRKLVLQQQKQYEERLKAKAQLAKMQKEIDNLSLLHSTNSSILMEKIEHYSKANPSLIKTLNRTDLQPAAFISNSSMYPDSSKQNQSNLESSDTSSGDFPTASSKLITEALTKPNVSSVSTPTTTLAGSAGETPAGHTNANGNNKTSKTGTAYNSNDTSLNLTESISGDTSASHILEDTSNPFETNSHEVSYLNAIDSRKGNSTDKRGNSTVAAVKYVQSTSPTNNGVIQFVTKENPSVANHSIILEHTREHLPSHSSFPFPLEIAYKPKIINPNSPSKNTEYEPREDGYVGCYVDRLDEGRDLPVRAGIPLVTPHNCISACRTTGYKYSGLQYGYLCFCGNAYGKYDIVPDSECNTVCSGNDSFTCGGLWRNEIFETDIRQLHTMRTSSISPNPGHADIKYEGGVPFYIAKEKDPNNGVATPIASAAEKIDIIQQRKSVIPTINDEITDDKAIINDIVAGKGVNAGQELLNEIHKYAITDLQSLEDETQEAMSHSKSGVVRAIQNMTDDEIISNAMHQASANAFQKNIFLPSSSSVELQQQQQQQQQQQGKGLKAPVLVNYFNRPPPQEEEEEEAKHSPELPVKIEPGTHLFRGEILLKQLWYDDMAKRDSIKFKILSGNIETAVKNIFSNDPSFLKTELMSLREAGRRVPHKTIADFSLTFYENKTTEAAAQKILSSVSKYGKLDEMPVYPQTLKIKEYLMDSNAQAFLPNQIQLTPLKSNVDTETSSRSYIPMSSGTSLYPSFNKAQLSSSARAHIRPVNVNEAQAKLRTYMSTQVDNADRKKALAFKQRSMIPKQPTIQKRNSNVPYVLRMFFWKDMLARKKRADKDGDRKVNKGKPRRSLDDVDEPSELLINRERRAQADKWPTVYKKDEEKQTYSNKLTPHLLKRVKRVFSGPNHFTDDIDTHKSFYDDLDSGYDSLFDEPKNNTVHPNSKTRKKNLFKITDHYHNHDRIHAKTVDDKTATNQHMNSSQTNSTDRFR